MNSALVTRDDQGRPYTVRYEAVNAMLLNEFRKEYRKIEEQGNHIKTQDRKVVKLEALVAQLQSALRQQAAQIQKVSTRLEVSKTAPQLIATNQ